MVTQEDVQIPDLPALVMLLSDFQIGQYSVEINRTSRMLFVWPTPPDEITELVKVYFEELTYLQPGVCDTCQQWHIRRFDAYWGASPLYCARCLSRIIKHFNTTETWPEVTIDE
jgi:hypothetical protein